MTDDISIKAEQLSKCYRLFDQPRDRLKQMVVPRIQHLLKRRVSNYFNEFWALKDVSFTLKKGESLGILGRNGAGKSTLLQLICGTLDATAGSCGVHGRIAALLELGSGFNPEFTGRENVILNCVLRGLSKADIENRIPAIEDFADIGDFINQPVRTYSSGMYARLAFSAAIHVDPDILIVDEILAVGDAPFQQKCARRIRDMISNGVSVILVSHDAYQVRAICSKALLLSSGRTVCFGEAEDVLREYQRFGRSGAAIGEETPIGGVLKADKKQRALSRGRISITKVLFHEDQVDSETKSTPSGACCHIVFCYEAFGNFTEDVSFVVNIYRSDGIYVFGTTTRMLNLPSFRIGRHGKVQVTFPRLNLLSGDYSCRVAINDAAGLAILAEANPAVQFTMSDTFKAVGVCDLETKWTHGTTDTK